MAFGSFWELVGAFGSSWELVEAQGSLWEQIGANCGSRYFQNVKLKVYFVVTSMNAPTILF